MARAKAKTGGAQRPAPPEAAPAPERLEALAQAGPGLDHPRGAAACLRRVLEQKVRRLADKGDLEPKEADELAKIGQALSRLEAAGYDLRTAAAEVMARFAAFVSARRADPEQRNWLADEIEAFFSHLEGGAR